MARNQCHECGAGPESLTHVWDDMADYEAEEPADCLGCTACNTMTQTAELGMGEPDAKPLKFAPDPLETLYRATDWNSLAATIRYDDERGIEPGDTLRIIGAKRGRVHGTGEVKHTKTVPVRRSLDVVQSHWAEYGTVVLRELVSNLNDYYADEIDLSTEVKVVIFDPDVEVDESA